MATSRQCRNQQKTGGKGGLRLVERLSRSGNGRWLLHALLHRHHRRAERAGAFRCWFGVCLVRGWGCYCRAGGLESRAGQGRAGMAFLNPEWNLAVDGNRCERGEADAVDPLRKPIRVTAGVPGAPTVSASLSCLFGRPPPAQFADRWPDSRAMVSA